MVGLVQNLKEFDIDHEYGAKAMRQFIGELTGKRSPHGKRLESKKHKKGDDELEMIYKPTITPPKVLSLIHI